MSSAIPRLSACAISGCAADERALPGQRIFHGDLDPWSNDAPAISQLSPGDLLHDGCAVYTWTGKGWKLVLDHLRDPQERDAARLT